MLSSAQQRTSTKVSSLIVLRTELDVAIATTPEYDDAHRVVQLLH